jgi:hypothetical protein
MMRKVYLAVFYLAVMLGVLVVLLLMAGRGIH